MNCNTSASQAHPEQIIGPNVPTVRSIQSEASMGMIITMSTLTTGLTPYTQYNCYVTAYTSAGEGTPSQIVTVRTDQSSKQNTDITPYRNVHIRKD